MNHARFIAYWYYRSKGYSVKSGILYGCDYMLYRKGPNFYHSEFGVSVVDETKKIIQTIDSNDLFSIESSLTWTDLQASVRTLAKVKKVRDAKLEFNK